MCGEFDGLGPDVVHFESRFEHPCGDLRICAALVPERLMTIVAYALGVRRYTMSTLWGSSVAGPKFAQPESADHRGPDASRRTSSGPRSAPLPWTIPRIDILLRDPLGLPSRCPLERRSRDA